MPEALSERDFGAAIAVWVLQHSLRPAEDITMIQRVLKPDARLFVVDATYRVAPALERPWVNDGIDIKRMLSAAFALEQVAGQVADPDLVMGISLASKDRGRRSGAFVADPCPGTPQLIACGRRQAEQGERTGGVGSRLHLVGEKPPFAAVAQRHSVVGFDREHLVVA